MDEGTDGDVLQRQSVAGFDVRVGAGVYHVAGLQAMGSNDISLFAVFILHQGNESGTVGVIFDAQHRSSHVVLLALEVDNTIFGATMANGDAAIAVTAGSVLHRSQQALFRTLLGERGIIRNGHVSSRCRSGFIGNNRHSVSHSS